MGSWGPAPQPGASGQGGASCCSAPGCGRLLTQRPLSRGCLLLRVAGGAGAPSCAGESALPSTAAAAISAFSGREGGRGLVAAAGAGFSPWSGLLSANSPLVLLFLLRAPPAPAPCTLLRSPGPGGERKGLRGAGEAGLRTRAGRKLLPDPCVPAPSVHPRPASAAAAAGKGSGGGGATGAGPAIPALSCGAWLLPTLFLSPPLLGPRSAPPARELLSPHLLGKENTPALVKKTFPADWVGAAVAGSPGSNLFSACLSCPAGCRL